MQTGLLTAIPIPLLGVEHVGSICAGIMSDRACSNLCKTYASIYMFVVCNVDEDGMLHDKIVTSVTLITAVIMR